MISLWPRDKLLPPSLSSINSSTKSTLTMMDMLTSKKWQDSSRTIWTHLTCKIRSLSMLIESSKSMISTETDSLIRESASLCLMMLLPAKAKTKLPFHNSTDSSLNTTSIAMDTSQRKNAPDLSRNSWSIHNLFKKKPATWWETLSWRSKEN